MKKIRKLLFALLVTPFIYSCGEAGVGFDVAAELPINVGTMLIPIPGSGGIDIPDDFDDIDPETIVFNYNLNDVDGFQDALEQLRDNDAEVILIGIAYEFSGINDNTDTYDEQVPLEVLEMVFKNDQTNSEIGRVTILNSSDGSLQNTPKTQIDISVIQDILSNELLSSQSISVDFVVNIGTVEIPTNDEEIDFDIQVYFDAAIRVRDIAN